MYNVCFSWYQTITICQWSKQEGSYKKTNFSVEHCKYSFEVWREFFFNKNMKCLHWLWSENIWIFIMILLHSDCFEMIGHTCIYQHHIVPEILQKYIILVPYLTTANSLVFSLIFSYRNSLVFNYLIFIKKRLVYREIWMPHTKGLRKKIKNILFNAFCIFCMLWDHIMNE